MALDKTLISFKKIFHKPHTSPNNPFLVNEGDNVGFPSDTSHIFGSKVPESPPTGSFYDIDGNFLVEKVRLPLEYIPGACTSNGRHGFYAKLPSDYEISSSNPKKGTGLWKNNQILAYTTGTIQIVSEFTGGKSYKLILRDKNETQIPALDPREWIGYEFGGIIYQETPPEPGAPDTNPGFLDCYLYIGDMADTVIANTSGSGIAFESQDLELTPTAVRVNLTGSGVSGSVGTGPSANEVTYTIPGPDYRQVLYLGSCGPFENFVTSSMVHSFSYSPKAPFVSSSVWYTDATKTKKIYEIDYGVRNTRKQSEKIIYKVYRADGTTVKSTVTDLITYDGPTELTRTRIVT